MHAVEKPVKAPRAPFELEECSATIFDRIHQDKASQSGLTYNPLPALPAFCSNDLFVPVVTEIHANPRHHTNSRVLVMDLDLTMVGDLSWFSDKENMRKNLGFLKPGTSEPIDTASNEDVVAMLRSGGMRPGLLAFLDRARRLGSLVVVYTHSLGEWASSILDGIVSLMGYQFFCALLARDSCNEIGPGSANPFRKSLDVVACRFKELHLYHEGSSAMAKTSFLMIDDNLVIREEEALLRCPPYVFVPSVAMDVTEGWLTADLIAANLQGGAWAPFNRLSKIMQEWGYWTPFEAMRRETLAHCGTLLPFMLYPEEIASGAAADDPPAVVGHEKALSRLNPDYAGRYLQAKANESVSRSDRFFETIVASIQSPMQLDARYLHSQMCGKI